MPVCIITDVNHGIKCAHIEQLKLRFSWIQSLAITLGILQFVSSVVFVNLNVAVALGGTLNNHDVALF